MASLTTGLDELPGLWNAFRCDMSLVGPRPLLMHYLPLYCRNWRCATKSAPPDRLSAGQRQEYDQLRREAGDGRLVRGQLDPALDFRILASTPVSVLRRDGTDHPGIYGRPARGKAKTLRTIASPHLA